MDLADPVVLTSIAQTAILTFSLVFITPQFLSQERATKEVANQNALADFTDAVRIVVDKPELRSLSSIEKDEYRTGLEKESVSPEETVVRNYFIFVYGVQEEMDKQGDMGSMACFH